MLDERIDLPHTSGVTAIDQWLDLRVGLTWSQAASLWCFPIETVSQSEGGIEGVYQSSAIIPHWHVTADERGRWDVRLNWNLDSYSQSIPREKRGGKIATAAPA
jgi:4-alpha-glucanotransferase